MMKKTKPEQVGCEWRRGTTNEIIVEKIKPEQMEHFRKLLGPGQVDQIIRQAIHTCWMSMPDKKKTIEDVAREIRRIVDRALKDFKEDEIAFGGDEGGSPQPPGQPSRGK